MDQIHIYLHCNVALTCTLSGDHRHGEKPVGGGGLTYLGGLDFFPGRIRFPQGESYSPLAGAARRYARFTYAVWPVYQQLTIPCYYICHLSDKPALKYTKLHVFSMICAQQHTFKQTKHPYPASSISCLHKQTNKLNSMYSAWTRGNNKSSCYSFDGLLRKWLLQTPPPRPRWPGRGVLCTVYCGLFTGCAKPVREQTWTSTVTAMVTYLWL